VQPAAKTVRQIPLGGRIYQKTVRDPDDKADEQKRGEETGASCGRSHKDRMARPISGSVLTRGHDVLLMKGIPTVIATFSSSVNWRRRNFRAAMPKRRAHQPLIGDTLPDAGARTNRNAPGL
jgi:hypothetical protein